MKNFAVLTVSLSACALVATGCGKSNGADNTNPGNYGYYSTGSGTATGSTDQGSGQDQGQDQDQTQKNQTGKGGPIEQPKQQPKDQSKNGDKSKDKGKTTQNQSGQDQGNQNQGSQNQGNQDQGNQNQGSQNQGNQNQGNQNQGNQAGQNGQACNPDDQNNCTVRISQDNLKFVNGEVQPLKLKRGVKVTWMNLETSPVSVVSDSGVFDSGILARDQSYSVVFDRAGVFKFHYKTESANVLSSEVEVSP